MFPFLLLRSLRAESVVIIISPPATGLCLAHSRHSYNNFEVAEVKNDNLGHILSVQGEKGGRTIRESHAAGTKTWVCERCDVFKEGGWAHGNMETVLEEETGEM